MYKFGRQVSNFLAAEFESFLYWKVNALHIFQCSYFFCGPRSGPFQSMGIMAQFLLNLKHILWNELRSAFFVLVSDSKALCLLKQFFNPSPNEKACHLDLPYNYTNNIFFYRDVFTYNTHWWREAQDASRRENYNQVAFISHPPGDKGWKTQMMPRVKPMWSEPVPGK